MVDIVLFTMIIIKNSQQSFEWCSVSRICVEIFLLKLLMLSINICKIFFLLFLCICIKLQYRPLLLTIGGSFNHCTLQIDLQYVVIVLIHLHCIEYICFKEERVGEYICIEEESLCKQ